MSEHLDDPVPKVDYRRTCVRPPWAALPEAVRTAVGEVAGSVVVDGGTPVGSGFTGGFAAVVRLADGRSVFAKAGSGTNPHLLEAYAREAEVLAALPVAAPAPALLGSRHLPAGEADEQAWQLLVTEAVPGRLPQPWTERDLGAVHDACVLVGEALSPLAHRWPEQVGEHFLAGGLAATYRSLADGSLPLTSGQPRWVRARLPELQALVDLAADALRGDVPGHGDVRADNVLVEGDRAVLVDWNWVMSGPGWTDWVAVLSTARPDGVDVDAWLARSPLTRDADPEAVDSWLALVAAYMLQAADEPVWPGGPPVVRVHQRRWGRLLLDWLGARRGWS